MKVKPCPECGSSDVKVYLAFEITKEYDVDPDTKELINERIVHTEAISDSTMACNACGDTGPLEIEKD